MDELRWILLVVGLLILAGIYFFADPSKRTTGQAESLDEDMDIEADHRLDTAGDDSSHDSVVPESRLERELERLGELISEDRRGDTGATATTGEHTTLNSEPEKIVTLFLRPRGNERINGADIVRAADDAGLVFGEMQIFHRMHEHQGHKTAVFSLADMIAPGSFEISHISTMSTPGLCLFLTLPNTLSALDAWDAMQAAGQRLADLLDTELLDDSQSSLSHQRIAHFRDEMREYDRQAGG